MKLPPIKIYTAEEELAYMIKKRDIIVKRIGLETYERLKLLLEVYIAEKEQK